MLIVSCQDIRKRHTLKKLVNLVIYKINHKNLVNGLKLWFTCGRTVFEVLNAVSTSLIPQHWELQTARLHA